MSVTSTAKNMEQSKYGIVPLRSFSKVEYDDKRNIWHSSTDTHGDIGTTVDELSRYLYLNRQGKEYTPTESFKRLSEAINNNQSTRISSQYNRERIERCLNYITPDNALTDLSILLFYRYIEYGKAVLYHRATDVFPYEPSLKHTHTRSNLLHNKTKIDEIRIMVERTLTFYDIVKPIEFGTKMIVNGVRGEVDLITKHFLIDLKTYGHDMTKKDSLQVATYYTMGVYLDLPQFRYLTSVGIFNARLNTLRLLPVSTLEGKKMKRIRMEVLHLPD